MWFVTSFENHAESKGEIKIGCGLQQALKITLDGHLQPKIDNENNYNTKFSQFKLLTKVFIFVDYKGSVF